MRNRYTSWNVKVRACNRAKNEKPDSGSWLAHLKEPVYGRQSRQRPSKTPPLAMALPSSPSSFFTAINEQ